MTNSQKFVLLAELDKLFNEDCKYLRKRWKLPQNQSIVSIKAASMGSLPLEYKRDLRFMLFQNKLPHRYFWALHQYLITRKITKVKDLPPPVRTFMRNNPLEDVGQIVIELDTDAGKKDVAYIFREVADTKKLLQRVSGTSKIYQPIRNFDKFLKLAKKRSLDSLIDLDDLAQKSNAAKKSGAVFSMSQVSKRLKNKWRVKVLRNKSFLSKNSRVSVENRKKLEEFHNAVDTDW